MHLHVHVSIQNKESAWEGEGEGGMVNHNNFVNSNHQMPSNSRNVFTVEEILTVIINNTYPYTVCIYMGKNESWAVGCNMTVMYIV